MSKIEDLVSEEGFLNVSTYNKKVKGKKAWVWEWEGRREEEDEKEEEREKSRQAKLILLSGTHS